MKNNSVLAVPQGVEAGIYLWLVLACSSAALAQSFEQAPKLCVGDEWRMHGTEFGKKGVTVIHVASTSDKGYAISTSYVNETQDDATVRVDQRGLDLNRKSVGEQLIAPDNQQFMFPLRVGKRWSINNTMQGNRKSANREPQVRTGEAVVQANEQLLTPAGSSDSFKIYQNGTIVQGQVRVSYQWTYWYAPAAKGIVKSDWRATIHGNTVELLRGELVSYKLNNCN